MAGKYRYNGEGTISRRKSDGRWVARYFVHTPGGKKRKALYARSRSEAATLLAKAISDRDGKPPISVEPRRLSVAEFLQEWLESKKADLAASTWRKYRADVDNKLTPALGSLKLAEVRRAHVEAFKDALRREHEPSTVRRILAVLSGALNQAVVWELVDGNPATNVKRPKDRGPKMRALSEAEVAALIRAVGEGRRGVLYALAAKIGPRSGELRALRWTDLRLDGPRPTATVERSVSTHNGVSFGPTKTGEARSIRLGRSLVAVLKRHRQDQREEVMARRDVWQDNGLVFPGPKGGVLWHQVLHRQFKEDLRAAGLPSAVRFHDLRHTSVTLMLRARVPVNVVARVHGHSDPAMTLRRYAHALPDMQEMAAEAADSYGF